VREVEEEVGVRPTAPGRDVAPLVAEQRALAQSRPPRLHGVGRRPAAPTPPEVAEMRWVSRGDLKETEWMGRPAYAVGNWVVWGLTYRILVRIRECGLL